MLVHAVVIEPSGDSCARHGNRWHAVLQRFRRDGERPARRHHRSAQPAEQARRRAGELGGAATGTAIHAIRISSNEEFETAFAAMEKDRPDAIIVQPSLPSKRAAELALKQRLPAFSVPRWFAEQGGLLSYSAKYVELFRKAAVYVDKILKGAHPADLPVEQPTHFELVINMKTANALGLTVPPALLARADAVIE